MIQTTRKYWTVVLDTNGDPVSVGPYDYVDMKHIVQPEWSPGTRTWTFLVDGDDVTERLAIDIAQTRRRASLQTSTDRATAITQRMCESLCLAIGWIVGAMLGPAFSAWQQLFMALWFLAIGCVPYLVSRRQQRALK